MDADSFQIVGIELSTSACMEEDLFPNLWCQANEVSELGKVHADTAYRGKECFDAVAQRGGEAIIDVP